MSARDQAAHLKVYSEPEIVAQWAAMDSLTACEQLLFDTYLHPGMAILDVGVGGGRTTPYLSAIASRYVGVDYSEEMIRACRSKFPHLRFNVADASDLSQFADASFDSIVFSFNGLDCLAPYENRENCLRECHRVLKAGGVYIFSTHNPRSLFLNWQWDRDHLRRLANRAAEGGGVLFHLTLAALTCGRVALSIVRSLAKAIPRAGRRLPTAAFWRGEGYIVDPSYGGMLMYSGIPACVIAELTRLDFRLLQVLPDNYPGRVYQYSTRWYYYAFSKD
ncbi:MAG TPA: class I SAM-dependent methyltransferase [Nitrospiraceae bacterium]|nr:class I SAM-dependent methyltransferase [Nitrospiraceae bacterium]